MKLSELKAFVDRLSEHAKRHDKPDPDVSFWMTGETERAVKAIGRTAIFIDTVPEIHDCLDFHRITAEGDTRGDYSIPLNLYKKD